MPAWLSLALIVTWAAGQEPDLRQRAEQSARLGRTFEALEQFQQILAAHPADVEARLWVARLLRRLGHDRLAEREYRQALAMAPQHVDALIGLAVALSARGATEEASDLVARAEALAPDNPDLLAARARTARLSGRPSEAEAYLARAHASSPDDQDIARAFEQVRRINRHRLEGSFLQESPGGSESAAHAGDIAVDVRASDRVRVSARVQAQRRFGREEARAGAGIEWRARPALTLRGSTLIGPGADVIARADTSAEVEHARGALELTGGIRRLSFPTAGVWIYSPGAALWLTDRTAVAGRYYASRTSFSSGLTATNHSGLARLRHQITPRAWLDFAYSRGYESFDTLSIDRLGTFRADTVSGGLLYHFGTLQSLSTSVDYQRRSDARSMVRITASMVHRF